MCDRFDVVYNLNLMNLGFGYEKIKVILKTM